MGKANIMTETVDRIINSNFGCSADEILKNENVTNNFVYSFKVSGDEYFLKLYRNKDWPEDGKIPFVYRCLSQKHIPCAELVAYCRGDEVYPNGYLIERKVQGTSADKIQLDQDSETGLYVKLAELLSQVHDINIENYGYIGSGVACYDSLIDFYDDEFDRFEDTLKYTLSATVLKRLKEKFFESIYAFKDLPSVLCHGDMSKKNIILNTDGEISLIDWDDAMALNWMADISRLTFWMKQNYSESEYILFRNTFLDHYRTPYRKAEFEVFERNYHIYTALDFLVFAINVGNRETEGQLKNYLEEDG